MAEGLIPQPDFYLALVYNICGLSFYDLIILFIHYIFKFGKLTNNEISSIQQLSSFSQKWA